jgi:hypothetical protein
MHRADRLYRKPHFNLNMEAVGFSETTAPNDGSTRRHWPQKYHHHDHRHHHHCHENLKSHRKLVKLLYKLNVKSYKAFWEISCMKWLSSGILHRLSVDDVGSKHLRNDGVLLTDYTMQKSWTQTFSYTPPWEPEMSSNSCVVWMSSKLKTESTFRFCAIKDT